MTAFNAILLGIDIIGLVIVGLFWCVQTAGDESWGD